MQSSLIGKIEKAHRYAQEPDRISFTDLSVKFRGENGIHDTQLKDGQWHCTCSFFVTWGRCSHTMALEKILGSMLVEEARITEF
ncbi:MAG: hypothetical protein E4H31_01575 [Dehalococcoidia bacterium]|jgi:hypothetical protein|nr:MAG: hypothetical protein E4H31_01575 [Dehalococcoidia bacterium]